MLKRPARQASLCVLLILFVNCAPSEKVKEEQRETEVEASQKVKIATWNIQHLGSGEHDRTAKENEGDLERLRQYADELDADVIAVQEVTDPSLLKRIYPRDSHHIECENGERYLLVCVVVRKNVGIQYTRHSDLASLDVTGGLRSGVDITLELGNDKALRLLAVHLKSGCFEGPVFTVDASAECEELGYQINSLERWIDDTASEETPFLVIGDFNRRLNQYEGEKADVVWKELDDGNPKNADLENVTEGREPKCWGGEYEEFIDHILVGRRASNLVESETFREIVYDKEPSLSNPHISRIH